MGSRSHGVLLKVLGKHDSVDMHDDFSAYGTLAKITKNPLRLCWTHVMNNAKELIQCIDLEGNYILSIMNCAYEMAE